MFMNLNDNLIKTLCSLNQLVRENHYESLIAGINEPIILERKWGTGDFDNLRTVFKENDIKNGFKKQLVGIHAFRLIITFFVLLKYLSGSWLKRLGLITITVSSTHYSSNYSSKTSSIPSWASSSKRNWVTKTSRKEELPSDCSSQLGSAISTIWAK